MQSLEDRIITNISKRGWGTIMSPLDYAGYGDSKVVRKAFERLTATEKQIRVARGVYCYPKIDKVLGLRILYPPIEGLPSLPLKVSSKNGKMTMIYEDIVPLICGHTQSCDKNRKKCLRLNLYYV